MFGPKNSESYVLLLIELNEKRPNHNPTTEVTGPVTCKMVGLSGLSLNNMEFHPHKFSYVDLNGAYQFGVWMAGRPHKNIVVLFLFFSWNIFVNDMESAEVSNFDWPNSACKMHEFPWTHSVLYGQWISLFFISTLLSGSSHSAIPIIHPHGSKWERGYNVYKPKKGTLTTQMLLQTFVSCSFRCSPSKQCTMNPSRTSSLNFKIFKTCFSWTYTYQAAP